MAKRKAAAKKGVDKKEIARRIIKGLAVLVLVLILFTFLFFRGGFQRVSTEKFRFDQGEEIRIDYATFSWKYCTCGDFKVELLRQTEHGWETVKRYTDGGMYCIDGTAEGNMGCDVRDCSHVAYVTNYMTWNQQMLEYHGETTTCDGYEGEQPIESYEHVQAPKGTYKVVYGNGEYHFQIV